MRGTTVCVLASSLVTLGFAAPTVKPGATFTVLQVAKNSTRKLVPAQVVANTYSKFGKAPPAAVRAAAASQSGEVTALGSTYDVVSCGAPKTEPVLLTILGIYVPCHCRESSF